MPDLNHERKVNVVGYSQGSAIVSHSLQIVENRLKDALGGFWANVPGFGGPASEATQKAMSNINAVGFGGAGKNFPPGPQYTFYVNKPDIVPNLLGVHPLEPVKDLLSFAVVGLNPVLAPLNGGMQRYSAPGAEVYLIDDPGQPGKSTPHDLAVYLSHVQPLTTGD